MNINSITTSQNNERSLDQYNQQLNVNTSREFDSRGSSVENPSAELLRSPPGPAYVMEINENSATQSKKIQVNTAG